MADFGFTEADEMMRNTAREFARGELTSGAKERQKGSESPLELRKKIGAAGFYGMRLPVELGGGGASYVQ